MTEPQELELTPVGAASLFETELSRAEEALLEGMVDSALDGYVRAMGLALQLGPAPTGQAVTFVLQAAHLFASQEDAASLAALGPALVGLISQMREAGAVPATAIMEAWAQFAESLGALIGQIGLALTLPSDHRSGMIANACSHAALLDDATDGRFSLTAWLDRMAQ